MQKALRVQNAGAVALIVVNTDNSVQTMGGSHDSIRIPVVMVGKDIGDLLMNGTHIPRHPLSQTLSRNPVPGTVVALSTNSTIIMRHGGVPHQYVFQEDAWDDTYATWRSSNRSVADSDTYASWKSDSISGRMAGVVRGVDFGRHNEVLIGMQQSSAAMAAACKPPPRAPALLVPNRGRHAFWYTLSLRDDLLRVCAANKINVCLFVHAQRQGDGDVL